MDENRKIVCLWDGNVESGEQPLRRPNQQISSSSVENVNASKEVISLSDAFNNSLNMGEDILAKSNLSVDAKEWYPPNYNPRSSAQDRLNRIRIQNGGVQNNSADVNEISVDLEKLQDIIDTLTNCPGKFDDLLITFLHIFYLHSEDVNAVSAITDLICDRALSQQSFRYNAARLCKIIEPQCPYFRSSLHLACKKKVDEIPYDYNLALFLAELYIQLNYDNLYGEFVIKTVQTVLSLGGTDNVKAVCQVLKLAGSSLEPNYFQAITDVCNQLQNLQSVVPNSLKNYINSVFSLRATNWGQSQNNSHISELSIEHESVSSHDGPVFYGPDGNMLSEEEKQFLAENDYESEPDLSDLNPEMDEYAQADYIQFLKFSKQC